MSQSNEPFIPASDRPEVKPDQRVADLTVRDLLSVLTSTGLTKLDSAAEHRKFLLKHEVYKPEHWKWENYKIELYKVEHVDVPVPTSFPGPDPGWAEVARGIAGLRAQVQELSSEVAKLRQERGQR
jgi:hypothetical protein